MGKKVDIKVRLTGVEKWQKGFSKLGASIATLKAKLKRGEI